MIWTTVAKVGAPLLASAALAGVVVVDGRGTADGTGATDAARSATAAPAAWIDAPLPGTTADPGALAVTAHAAHPDGIVELAVWVDDGEASVAEVDGDAIEHATVEVELIDPGWHLVSVSGRTAAGGATPTATVGITVTGPTTSSPTTTAPPDEVAAPPAPSSSTAPTAPGPIASGPTAPVPTTPGPTATRPTTATTACTGSVAPSPTAPPDGFASSDGDVDLQWAYAGCNPPTFRVEWSLDPAFPPLATESTTVAGTARSAVVVVPCGPGSWRWRVRAELSGLTVIAGPWSAARRFSYPTRIC